MFDNSVYNKINITVSLLAVFFLVLATNRIDKRHFDKAQNALIAVHDDRVVAQDYIFKMINVINQQRLDLVTGENLANFKSQNDEIGELIELYGTTKLTSRESKIYERLGDNFIDLDKFKSPHAKNEHISNVLDAIKDNVDQLALIQVTESKQLTSIAQKSLDMNSLLSNIELVFLVIIVLFIQFVVFYKVKKKQVQIKENEEVHLQN